MHDFDPSRVLSHAGIIKMIATTSTIGFPRIGPKREMKKALEDYWAGKSPQNELIAVSQAVDEAAWRAQDAAGIDLIALDGTFYDHVLDVQSWLGLIPERFHHLAGLDRYFAAARGTESAIALDMSKYFDTNYVREPHLFPFFSFFFFTVCIEIYFSSPCLYAALPHP